MWQNSLYWTLIASLWGGYQFVLRLSALTGPGEFCQFISNNFQVLWMSDVGLVGWAKYFQQSAQSNFIHKFLRQGKLQLTLGPGGSVAQNQSENIWQSRNQKFVLRNLDLQKPPSWDKTLKSGGNLKLRLGLDPSTTLAEMGPKSLGQSQVF